MGVSRGQVVLMQSNRTRASTYAQFYCSCFLQRTWSCNRNSGDCEEDENERLHLEYWIWVFGLRSEDIVFEFWLLELLRGLRLWASNPGGKPGLLCLLFTLPWQGVFLKMAVWQHSMLTACMMQLTENVFRVQIPTVFMRYWDIICSHNVWATCSWTATALLLQSSDRLQAIFFSISKNKRVHHAAVQAAERSEAQTGSHLWQCYVSMTNQV